MARLARAVEVFVDDVVWQAHPVSRLEPPTSAKALLFDCDGTLVDTVSLYRIAWHQEFGRRGFDMSDEWYAERQGLQEADFVLEAFPDADADTRAVIAAEGHRIFETMAHLLEPLEHVVDVVRRHHGLLPLAVVSAGTRESVHRSLAVAGIGDLFDQVITIEDDDGIPKPAPDVYLLAAVRLGVEPRDCVAYEDSSTGMASARAAGIGHIFDIRLA